MFRRARHQQGSLQRVKRKSGETVWVFRWRETQINGSRRYRKIVVGSVEEFKTESEAQNAVDALRLTINEQTPRQQLKEISFETLVQHYRQHEMPDIFYKKSQMPEDVAEDENRKSYATQDTYEGYLRKWILPRWKSYRLPDVKAVQVEQWLKSLPLAPGSKAKLRNIMSALYSHAIPLGMGDTQSHYSRSAECQTQENPNHLEHRSDQGLSPELEGASPDCGVPRCVERSKGGRITWAQMGGRGLRVVRGQRHALRGQAEDHPMQDGSLSQADSVGRRPGRGVVELEATVPISGVRRLGVCLAPQEGQTTVLAGRALSRSFATSAEGSRNSGQRGMAYAAAHVRHFDESQWRRHEDHSGAPPPFQLQSDSGYVHASGDTNQTSRADQTGENVLASEGCRGRVLKRLFPLLDPSEPSGKMPISANSFGLLASPTGFEPVLPP